MIESKTIEIDGATYTVAQLPAFKALKLKWRIMQAIGPSAAKLIAAIVGGGGLARLETDELAPAAKELFDRLSADDLLSFARELLGPATVMADGKLAHVLDVFDIHFAGKLASVYRLIWFALEVNYGDFLGDIKDRLASAITKASPTVESTT
jgi:hypothetical protein